MRKKLKLKISCFIFGLLFPVSIFSQNFTLAVIPDIQNYTYFKCQKEAGFPYNYSEVLFNQMNYIKNNSIKNGGKISFAIQLGDLVESRAAMESEWELADKALSIIDDEVPYLVVPGNHDCDEWIHKDNSVKMHGWKEYIEHFGPESYHFKNKDYYCGSYNGLNSYAKLNIDDKKILIIGLEIEPSDDVLNWVQDILNENTDYATILFMHEYLSLVYDAYNPGFALRINTSSLRNDNLGNSPENIWNKLIKKNKQIFLVLCGHCFEGCNGESCRTDVDIEGYKVYSFLSDYQGRAELFDEKRYPNKKRACGDGWLRFLEFDFSKNLMWVKTYSTETNEYERDRNSYFVVKFDWDWNSRFHR